MIIVGGVEKKLRCWFLPQLIVSTVRVRMYNIVLGRGSNGNRDKV